MKALDDSFRKMLLFAVNSCRQKALRDIQLHIRIVSRFFRTSTLKPGTRGMPIYQLNFIVQHLVLTPNAMIEAVKVSSFKTLIPLLRCFLRVALIVYSFAKFAKC